MKPEQYKISKEKFVFASNNNNLHDNKLETKPVSYLKDALYRFTRNKASIVAAIIIGFLLLFAVFVPIFSPYTVAYEDTNFAFAAPKSRLFSKMNIPFWDGCANKDVAEETYTLYNTIEIETGKQLIKNGKYTTRTELDLANNEKTYYQFRLDTYYSTGVVFKLLSLEEYQSLQKYQDKTGIQVIYPQTEYSKRPQASQDQGNANYWFATTGASKTKIDYDENGELQNIYKEYVSETEDMYTSKVRVEGEGNYSYSYADKKQGNYEVRIDYYEYYVYYHTTVLKDGITTPCFLFGATNNGKDVLTCLASGARFSFILAIIVATVNLLVGAIYGAIEGYYGGKIDLVMERIVDVLAAIPTMIVIVLLRYHLNVSHVVILFIAFFLTGWMGMAGRTRMQFYRFKNQEYVLVARTLGAKDGRIMFKHIFPNAIGTLITGSVLIIPSVIFSETSLSYLGIINLSTGNLTSVGTLLATGQNYLFTYPHMILFPAVFISLLMLSFNLFGNGLRDAFNPSLRGAE